MRVLWFLKIVWKWCREPAVVYCDGIPVYRHSFRDYVRACWYIERRRKSRHKAVCYKLPPYMPPNR